MNCETPDLVAFATKLRIGGSGHRSGGVLDGRPDHPAIPLAHLGDAHTVPSVCLGASSALASLENALRPLMATSDRPGLSKVFISRRRSTPSRRSCRALPRVEGQGPQGMRLQSQAPSSAVRGFSHQRRRIAGPNNQNFSPTRLQARSVWLKDHPKYAWRPEWRSRKTGNSTRMPPS